jgi:GNAT superfamily N-acetyltransferase
LYWIASLGPSDYAHYELLSLPNSRYLLWSEPLDRSVIAVGASFLDLPVGLVLARIRGDEPSAAVHSIYVKRQFRNVGLGTRLLRCLEQVLRERSCHSASLAYRTGTPSTLALERVLNKCEWESGRTQVLIYETSLEKITQAPWIARPLAVTNGIEIFPWSEISDADRRSIDQRQKAAPWIPEALTPSKWEEAVEPHTSLGLRCANEVSGWIITHRIRSNSLRYSSAWVRPGVPKIGGLPPFFALLAESIRRAAQAGFCQGTWLVPVELRSMAGFSVRCMKPYTLSYSETRVAEKGLA